MPIQGSVLPNNSDTISSPSPIIAPLIKKEDCPGTFSLTLPTDPNGGWARWLRESMAGGKENFTDADVMQFISSAQKAIMEEIRKAAKSAKRSAKVWKDLCRSH
jgi:hypothetical protein